jgi:hypothetical protein
VLLAVIGRVAAIAAGGEAEQQGRQEDLENYALGQGHEAAIWLRRAAS